MKRSPAVVSSVCPQRFHFNVNSGHKGSEVKHLLQDKISGFMDGRDNIYHWHNKCSVLPLPEYIAFKQMCF